MTNHTVATKKQQAKPVAQDLAKDIWSAMGDHPVDILGSIKIANKALEWVGEICKTIEQEAKNPAGPSVARIRMLADMGGYLSDDYSNLTVAAIENMSERMAASGLLVSKEQHEEVAA